MPALHKIGRTSVPMNMLMWVNSIASCGVFSPTVAVSVIFAMMMVMPTVGVSFVARFLVCVWPHRSFVYLVDLMFKPAPTANNVMVMAELAGEIKQRLATSFFTELFQQAGQATAWRPCNVGTLSIEHVEEIFNSQVSELIDVSAITAEAADVKVFMVCVITALRSCANQILLEARVQQRYFLKMRYVS